MAGQPPPIATSLAVLALVGLVLLLMHLAAPVLVPVLFAFYVAALAMPVFTWLQRHGVKRGPALLVLIVSLAAGGIALLLLALSSVRHLQSGLQLYSAERAARLAGLQEALTRAGISGTGVLRGG